MNLNELKFVCILIPAYWFWRTYKSIKAREAILDKVDSFLGSRNHSKISKHIVYCAFDDSQEHFFVLKLIINTIFVKKEDRKKYQDIKKTNKADLEAAAVIIKELLLINIKLSPLTWFVTIFFFLSFAIFKAALTPTTDKFSSFEKRASAGAMKAICS